MCGIIGAISTKDVASGIFDGLKKLEYRGYDSAGIATIAGGKIEKRRAQGKLNKLSEVLKKNPLPGFIGIGHTRWATHGVPNEANAHPHATGKVAVVHNGIIENYKQLREELESKGYKFSSETDTEVVPQLITFYLDKGEKRNDAVIKAVKRLTGAFALGIIFADAGDLLVAARRGSPLAVGFGNGDSFIGSDAIALASFAKEITYLEDGDIAFITREDINIIDESGNKVNRQKKKISLSNLDVAKGNYSHYMLKEIFEQMSVIGDTYSHYYDHSLKQLRLPEFPFTAEKLKKISFIACGTSFYAGMVAKYWFEKIVKIPVEVEIASEYRYRDIIFEKDSLAVFISQSGETADTLSSLRYAKKNGQHIIGIVNVPESTIAREADVVLRTYAGPEIGVASTKVFTTQLMVLACLAIGLGLKRKTISEEMAEKYLYLLSEIPTRIAEILSDISVFEKLSKELAKASDIIYIGRGTSFAIALEGALKLKEISYIHAEANAAGELKHGSIALIDDKVPVIVIAPRDELFEKTASNAQEVAARGGKIFLLSDSFGGKELEKIYNKFIRLPETMFLTSPIIYAVPVQLLAYYTAVEKGTDIDQPRNLAKSVTVE